MHLPDKHKKKKKISIHYSGAIWLAALCAHRKLSEQHVRIKLSFIFLLCLYYLKCSLIKEMIMFLSSFCLHLLTDSEKHSRMTALLERLHSKHNSSRSWQETSKVVRQAMASPSDEKSYLKKHSIDLCSFLYMLIFLLLLIFIGCSGKAWGH